MKTIGHRCWHFFLFLAFFSINAQAQAGELVDRHFTPQSYPYSDHRNFYVYVPNGYDGQSPLPMVMVLHGCHQSRDTVIDEFGWDSIAERFGFIVVAPDISTNDLFRNPHCWGYWESKEIHQGQGEVEDLRHIGMQVEAEWRIAPNQRHITGLSSGGFMANAAAVAHNEYWASAGVHSGGGYKESATTYAAGCSSPRESSGQFKTPAFIAAAMRAEMDSDYQIPVMLFHSLNDCTVGYGVNGDPTQWGGLTSNRDAWLSVNGGTLYDSTDCSQSGIACRHQKFGNIGHSTLEVVRINGLTHGTKDGKGHYWSGGKAVGQWTNTRGPNAALHFWNFFQRHPRSSCANCPGPPGGLTATHIGENGVSLSWRTPSETNLKGYYLYRDGSKTQPEPIAMARYKDDGLKQSTTYAYHVTAVNNAGKESLPSPIVIITTQGPANCRRYSSKIDEHVAQKRAYSKEQCNGWWCWFWPFPKSISYHAVGSDEYLGTIVTRIVILYSTDDTTYHTQACQPIN